MASIYNPPYLASEAQVEITQSMSASQHWRLSDQLELTLRSKGSGGSGCAPGGRGVLSGITFSPQSLLEKLLLDFSAEKTQN